MSSTSSSTRKRVALIDDHEIVAIAFTHVMEGIPGLEFIGSASTVDELLAHDEKVDLVVLDLRLSDGSSPTSNVERLRATGADVLAYTSGESPYLIRLAARAGVLGIIRKSAPTSELVRVLERAASGEAVISADWAAAVDSDPEIHGAPLSPRERRVLELYASGMAAKQVGFELSIAENTVEDYLRRIRQQYASQGRRSPTKVDLYKRALEDGILPHPDARA
ncbi:MAG: Transcriptional regulatory protein DesR [Actinomycetota bacterium]|jgi:DNA-binding NarL/FixJ family response regulator